MMYDWIAPVMYGPFHWLVFAAVVAVIAYPIGRVLRRIGFSPLWAVLVFVPMVNVLGLWIFALSDWPKRLDTESRESS